MEITYNNTLHKICFAKLQQGDVFQYDTILFMKIATSTKQNAVRLDNGKCTDFIDEFVEPVKGKFVMD